MYFRINDEKLFEKYKIIWTLDFVCSYHVTYAFQSELASLAKWLSVRL